MIKNHYSHLTTNLKFHPLISKPLYSCFKHKQIGLRGIIVDITERQKAEEQISKSLKEKNILLKEVYHLVKNILAVVSALIN